MEPEQIAADTTRERLLDEAEKLFAEKGFDAVSVREITAKAGSHLSAVNYHFGSKRNLYFSVFQERWIPRAKRILSSLDLHETREGSSAEDIVHAMSESFILGFANDAERHRHHQLIYREMSQPSEALRMVAEQVTKPFFLRFKDALRSRLPASQNVEYIFMCVFSVFAQIVFFNVGRNMVSILTGREYDQAFSSQVVDHITRFSLYGLSGRAAEAGS
ncbi:hypothetical protein AAU61_12610 [Desulfocarbo indianensis]|nr:hypothetical protein AAU61_12610 [Desulfocarbo indianensis]